LKEDIMSNFTPASALIGGLLIGLAAVILLLFNGRVMGVTGITGGILQPERHDVLWRVLFLMSLAVAPILHSWASSSKPIVIEVTGSLPSLIIGGFLTGLGACAGSGCTSGHGVCGLGRLSTRSLVVTVTFMITSIATVYVTRHLLGSAS
jgi:uncharacterized membrane protein YedE/YeeE